MILDILKVVILSIVEAFTEFIPVSSTGHMIIVEDLIKLSNNKDFVNAFQVIIQLGAILAVIVIFFNKLYPFKKDKEEKRKTFSLWYKIIVATIPAMIFGLLFDDIISSKLFNPISVSITLIFYGIILIYIETIQKKENIKSFENLSYFKAFLIGLFQCLALIPGTSRSAATIIGASFLGLNKVLATEFSFFLAIPTMIGASFLKLLKIGFNLSFYELFLIFLALFITFILSLVIIKKFLDYIKKHSFKIFGYYRIILGIIVLMYYMMKK